MKVSIVVSGFVHGVYARSGLAERHAKCFTGCEVVTEEIRDRLPPEIQSDLNHEYDDDEVTPIVEFTHPEDAKPYKPDMIRVDRGEWKRVSGLSMCAICGCDYYEHPSVRGYSWLTRLCNGNLVKL